MEPKSPCLYPAVSLKYPTIMSQYWQIQQSMPKRSIRHAPRRHAAVLKSDWPRLNRTLSAPSYKVHLNVRWLAFEFLTWLEDGAAAELRRHTWSNKLSIV